MRQSFVLFLRLVCAAGCTGTSFLITPVPTTYKLKEI